jgi:hypothetical protein
VVEGVLSWQSLPLLSSIHAPLFMQLASVHMGLRPGYPLFSWDPYTAAPQVSSCPPHLLLSVQGSKHAPLSTLQGIPTARLR